MVAAALAQYYPTFTAARPLLDLRLSDRGDRDGNPNVTFDDDDRNAATTVAGPEKLTSAPPPVGLTAPLSISDQLTDVPDAVEHAVDVYGEPEGHLASYKTATPTSRTATWPQLGGRSAEASARGRRSLACKVRNLPPPHGCAGCERICGTAGAKRIGRRARRAWLTSLAPTWNVKPVARRPASLASMPRASACADIVAPARRSLDGLFGRLRLDQRVPARCVDGPDRRTALYVAVGSPVPDLTNFRRVVAIKRQRAARRFERCYATIKPGRRCYGPELFHRPCVVSADPTARRTFLAPLLLARWHGSAPGQWPGGMALRAPDFETQADLRARGVMTTLFTPSRLRPPSGSRRSPPDHDRLLRQQPTVPAIWLPIRRLYQGPGRAGPDIPPIRRCHDPLPRQRQLSSLAAAVRPTAPSWPSRWLRRRPHPTILNRVKSSLTTLSHPASPATPATGRPAPCSSPARRNSTAFSCRDPSPNGWRSWTSWLPSPTAPIGH